MNVGMLTQWTLWHFIKQISVNTSEPRKPCYKPLKPHHQHLHIVHFMKYIFSVYFRIIIMGADLFLYNSLSAIKKGVYTKSKTSPLSEHFWNLICAMCNDFILDLGWERRSIEQQVALIEMNCISVLLCDQVSGKWLSWVDSSRDNVKYCSMHSKLMPSLQLQY